MNELQNPVPTIPVKNRLLAAEDFIRLSEAESPDLSRLNEDLP